MDERVTAHHRDTIRQIFSHPSSGNIEWRNVHALFDALGVIENEANGKLTLTLCPEREFLEIPRDKDIDQQMIVDLRRMLRDAGYAPESVEAKKASINA
jgi:hypothetical protein